MPRGLAALALLFLAAHLALLPGTLGDIDSINFALGVREFNVAQHQPHPPGYPVYVALASISTRMFDLLGVAGPEARGLAFWGALAGTALVPLLFMLFHALDGSTRRAAAATVLAVTAPVLWFTALRPLSDVTGLAAAVAAQVLLLRSGVNPAGVHALTAGAFVAGFAIGVRSQTFLLTLPLLAVMLVRVTPRSWLTYLKVAGALITGVLVWAIPLLIASGGVGEYLAALEQQGSEDFSGVVMLWTMPTVRVAASALQHTFVSPWASWWTAAVVLIAATAGAATVARRPGVRLIVAALVLPYLAFHLLFQEAVTVRYALPLVPGIAWLAVQGIDRMAPRVLPVATLAIAGFSLALAIPATIAYARVPAPIFRAMHDLESAQRVAPITVASHRRVFAESRRVREWLHQTAGTWLPSPPGFEWLQLTQAWRSGTASAAWFLANPRRTDLALVDTSEASLTRYRWPFDSSVFAGGARPDEFDGYAFARPPGWFLEQGWALTPEIAGVTFRDGHGPHQKGSVGWIRRRPDGTELVLGGRHLGAPGAPPVRLVATIDGRTIIDRQLEPGFFAERVALPAGTLRGEGPFARIFVTSEAVDGSPQPVSLEHFDVQSVGVPMFAFEEGWYEPEQERGSARQWRWMSPRATLWVRPVGRDVTLRIAAESPVRYFGRAPELRVSAAGTLLAHLSPSRDFTWEVVVPGEQLAETHGELLIESDRQFVPGKGTPDGDHRSLALRVYSVEVE